MNRDQSKFTGQLPGSTPLKGLWWIYGLVLVLSWIGLAFSAANPDWVLSGSELDRLSPEWRPPMWMVIPSLAGVALLILVPKWPLIGLLVLVVVGYGLPRRESYSFFCQWHVLEVIVSLTVMGTYFYWKQNHLGKRWWHVLNASLPRRAKLILTVLVALVAWLMVSALAATLSGDYQPAVNHHPVHMLDALGIAIVAAYVLRSRQAWIALAVVLCVTLGVRALAAPQFVPRNGDLGILFAMAACLALLVAAHESRVSKVFAVALCAAMVFGLTATENRGGALSFLMGLLALWLLCRWKLRTLVFIVPILLIGVVTAENTGIWKRFESVWAGGPDRASVDSRIVIYEAGWDMALSAPLLGVGLGNFEHRMSEFSGDGTRDSPHNHVIGMLAEGGFPAAVLFLLLFGLVIVNCVITAYTTSASGINWLAACAAGTIIAYFTGGMFMTRHTFELAYLLVGGVLAIAAMGEDASSSTSLEVT